MPIRFNPTGTFDIATDPCDLPFQVDGKIVVSGAMARCTNLTLDRQGIASTRLGSAKVNGSALDQTSITRLLEMAGYRYAFAGTKIYRDEVSIATGLTAAQWSGALHNAYNTTTQAIFALNGTDRKRIEGASVNEWGIDAPTVAPTLAVGALAGLTGDYNARYTYCRKEGALLVCESNPSPAASAAVSLSNQSLSVTWTASGDSQVTHVRIYRTLTGGAVYYYDQEVAVPTTTLDTNTDDSALGTEVATDHNRPPAGTVVLGPAYQGTLFILKDNLLYYSLPNQPEYWPATYYIEVCPVQYSLRAGAFLDGQLFLSNGVEIYAIMGTGHQSFYPLPMSAMTGVINQDSFLAVKGHGIFRIAIDVLYQYTGGKDNLISRGQFEPLFQGNTIGSVPGLNRTYIDRCWLAFFRGKLFFAYPGGASAYPDNMLVLDLATDKGAHYQFGAYFQCAALDATNKRLLAGDTGGYIWELEKLSQTTDGGAAISWQIQTMDFNQLHKYFPRYARYDVTLGTGAASVYGHILLDDVIKQSHLLSESRQTRKRHVIGCTGDRMAARLAGEGPVDIYGIEIE